MKKFLLLLTLFCAAAAVNAAPQFAPKAVSPRSYQEGKEKIELLKQGKVQFQLYIPKDAKRTLRQDATEFVNLLSEICGTKIIPVTKISPGKVTLRYGDVEFARAQKIDLSKLDRDGFVIKAEGKDILLAGGDAVEADFGRGTLFAAYEFLERFAGVRFYFPGKMGTILPQKKDWSIPTCTLYDRPDNQFRRIYWVYKGQKWYDDNPKFEWAKIQHQKHLRQSTLSLPNCHGIRYLALLRRFGKTHPEYFAMKDDGSRFMGQADHDHNNAAGQICFSQPGLQEEIYLDAKAVLTGQPASSRGVIQDNGQAKWSMHGKPFFNLMPNDSMARCRCPGCRPHFDPENKHERYTKEGNRFLWHWLLQLPKRLKKENIPGYVTMMAYDLCREIPEEDFPDNVVLQVATRGPWNIKSPEKEKEEALIKAWCKKTGSKIYQWNYPTKYVVRYMPDLPNFTPYSVGSYYKRIAPYSFGCFFEAESDYWFFGHLNFYIFSKMMWNTSTDYEAVIDEYCTLMFGKGAAPVKEVFKSLESHWLNEIVGNSVDTPLGPVNTPPSEYQLWNKIYSQKEIARLNGLFDKAVKLAAGDKLAVERIHFVRNALWQPTCDAANLYEKNNRAVEYWQAEIGVAATAPVIDGKPDDAVWKNAPKIHLIPLGTDKAAVQTIVKLLADKDYFYFLFDCREPETDKMIRKERKFDDLMIWSDNAVEIHLDTEGTRKNKYQLMINSDGALADLSSTPDKLQSDWKWNSKAEVKTSTIPGKGWFAEIKVPRSSFPPVKGKTFVANFTRHRNIKGNKKFGFFVWSPYVKNFGDLPNFGVLRFGPPAEQNLIVDGDLALVGSGKKQKNWTSWSGLPAADTEVFRTAGVSLRFEGKKAHLIQTLKTIKPDTEYRLSYFLKLENVQLEKGVSPRQGGFYFKIYRDNQHVISYPKEPLRGTIPWRRFEYRFRSFKEDPKNPEKRPYIHFSLRGCTGKMWLDHVELVEIKK